MDKFIFLFLGLLIGCQSTEVSLVSSGISDPQSLYVDQSFKGFSDLNIMSESEIFSIDESMKLLISRDVKKHSDIHKKSTLLLRILLNPNGQQIHYDINANTAAIETFYSGRANCLSLTILAYTLAKEANINVKFQDVIVPEYWISNGEYSLLAGHINLAVTSNELTDFGDSWGREVLEIDFDPASIKKTFPRKIIQINTVTAMFYNNIAAQALVNKQYVKAYALLKASTLADPRFSPAWGNLGILYKNTQHLALAESAYRYAIEVSPSNYSALTNLSTLLREQGDSEELSNIDQYLAAKRLRNPYYYAMLAGKYLHSGELALSEHYFKKAIKLNPQVHEFYYGLAKVYSERKNYDKARALMLKALYFNDGKDIEEHYQSKLNFLSQASVR